MEQQSESGTARQQQGDTARDSVRMAELDDTHGPAKIATLKVLYLLAITAAVFAVPAVVGGWALWLTIVGLLALQILILLACRIASCEIVRPVSRLKWLFAFLIAAYTLLPGEDGSSGAPTLAWHIPVVDWSLPINLAGLEQAGRMCLQIVTMLFASSVVRLTGTGRDLVEGLESFRLPGLFVYSLDHTLELLGGARPRGSGRGGGKGAGGGNDDGGGGARASRGGFLAILRRLLRGDVAGFVQEIRGDVARAGEQIAGEQGSKFSARMAHDVATVSGIALTMATLKIFRLLPGIPFASGHKVILLFPLYVLASRLTYSRWGATAAGSVMGVIGFLPAYQTMVALVAPPRLRSQAFAWSLFWYALGAVFWTPIVGSIGDAHGERSAVFVLGLLVGGLLPSEGLFQPRHPVVGSGQLLGDEAAERVAEDVGLGDAGGIEHTRRDGRQRGHVGGVA